MYKEYRKFSIKNSKELGWYQNLTKDRKSYIKYLPLWMKLDFRLKIIEKFIDKDKLVIDMGCGAGEWVDILNSNNFNCIGIDFSYNLIELCKSRYPNYLFYCCDIRKTEFPNDYCDALISWGVIEHDEDGIDASISEFYRLLKKDGIAIITVPYDNIEARNFSKLLYYENNDNEFFQYYLDENDIMSNIYERFELIEWNMLGITAFSKLWPNLYIFLSNRIYLLRIFNVLTTLFIRHPKYKLMAYFVLKKI